MAAQLDSDGRDHITPDGRRYCALVTGPDAVLGFSRGELVYAWPDPNHPDRTTLSLLNPMNGGRMLGAVSLRDVDPGYAVSHTVGYGKN